jgi:hypothetical protein
MLQVGARGIEEEEEEEGFTQEHICESAVYVMKRTLVFYICKTNYKKL